MNPNRTPNPAGAIPLAEFSYNPNSGNLSPPWTLHDVHIGRLKKGVPKQKSLNMIQAVQQKPNDDPSGFLERIYRAYWKYTDADPQVPVHVQMETMILLGKVPQISEGGSNI